MITNKLPYCCVCLMVLAGFGILAAAVPVYTGL